MRTLPPMRNLILTIILLLVSGASAAAVIDSDPRVTDSVALSPDSLLSPAVVLDTPVLVLDSGLIDTLMPAAIARPITVAIEQLLVGDMRLRDTLDILLTGENQSLGGYELKVAVGDPAIDIIEILPGYLHDSCGWEYFNTRRNDLPARENYPGLVWQIIALSQFIPDSARPICYTIDGTKPIARLVVSNEHMREMPDTTIPIYFYWEDCSDNSIADQSGKNLLISRRVFDYAGAAPDSTGSLLPSRVGAPRQCVNPAARNPLLRLIDFHNGAVTFRLDLSPLDTGEVPAKSNQ